jgi:hypothetical protein
MPRWTPDGRSVVALRSNAKGKTITQFDVAANSAKDLMAFSDENKGYPVPFGDFILFNSPAGGIDNIYAWKTSSNERFQITTSKYGAYNPSISQDGKTIFYNEQSRDGMNVVKMPFDPGRWIKQDAAPAPVKPLFQPLVEQEGQPDLLKQISSNSYQSRRYHRASGMINPHSWGPYFVNTLTRVNIGITSQDILSTTSIDAGYSFDINERTGAWRAAVSYQGFFPIIDVTATRATRSVDEGTIEYAKRVGSNVAIVQKDLAFDWDESTIEAGLRIPLLTTTSKYYGNLSFSNYVGVTEVTNFHNSIDGGGRLLPTDSAQYFFRTYQDKGTLLYNHFGLSATRLLKQSRRDIYSKWGQFIYVDLFNTPYGGDYSGTQASVYSQAYFPGFAKHHSVWGYWAYQKTDMPQVNLTTGKGLDNYVFRNQIPVPRGQSVSRFQDFYSMSLNYTLPLWYPDIAVGPLVNFQRLRANLFGDYGYGKSIYGTSGFSQTYTSVGGELRIDLNVMRFLPQFNVGVRYSYGITPATTRFEVLIGAFNF